MKKLLTYSLPLGASGAIETSVASLDKLILSAFLTPEIYAVYSVGNLRIPLVGNLFRTVGEVTLPRAVELLNEKKTVEFLALWKKLLVRLSFIGIGIFFAAQLVAYDLITLLFTEKYESSVLIFRIILFLIFKDMLLYGIILRSLGHTNDILRSNLISLTLYLPITIFIVKYFGIIGAAISSVFGFYLIAGFQLFYSIKQLRVTTNSLFPLGTILKLTSVGLTLLLAVFFLQDLITSKYLRLTLSATAFSALYVFACYKLNIYNIFREKVVLTIATKLGFTQYLYKDA